VVRQLRVALAFCIVVALTGCGGGGGAGGKVGVELTDYDVILSTSSVSAGTVDFAIDNRGGFVHEMLVVRTDLAIDRLPKTADGRFDETSAQVKVVASVRHVAAGGTASLTKKLAAGGYFLICNLPAEPGDAMSHFQHGMLAPFTVT
jgi:uncharacterized cupredoxin-like copper-binding protein